MTITTQEWTMEPEPGDENYRVGRVERLKQWFARSIRAQIRSEMT